MLEVHPVKLTLTTKIFQDNGDEDYNFETQGQLMVRNGAAYLSYDEELPDQEVVRVVFKIRPDQVRLTRRASAYKTALTFAQDKRLGATYPTPAGNIEIETLVTAFNWDFDQDQAQGKLDLDYVLYAQQSVVSQNQVRLHFEP